MNNFYVYLHKLNNGEVFYVGKGRRDRAYSKLGRSNAWKEKAKEGFDVEIYKSDLKELDSILLEKELIEKFKSTVVNKLDNSLVLEIDYNQVSAKLEYDCSSPSFLKWKLSGKNAGCLNKNTGYFVVRLNDVLYQAHRIVWILHNKTIDSKLVIDHLDNNRVNNSIENLRLVTKTANSYNQKKEHSCGVVWQNNKNGLLASAIWKINGIKKSKSFSVNKYGKEEAFKLALDYRTKIITEILNGL